MEFREELEKILAQVPRGTVVTCGTLAGVLGDVAASRAIARIVARAEVGGPLHRVVKSDGTPIASGAIRLLQGEGVEVSHGRASNRAQLHPEALAGRPILREFRREQVRLRSLLRVEDEPRGIETVGGVDLSYPPRGAIAACVVTARDGSEVLETAVATIRHPFPYVPGYLAYRERDGVAGALSRLSEEPDVLLLDGHGILHPAGFGLACHVGVAQDLRTVGVAKSPLVGRMERAPEAAMDASEMRVDGEVKGYAVKPPTSKRLLYVSPGHRIGLESALQVVRRLLIKSYPEPLRMAHNLAAAERRKVSPKPRSRGR